MGLVRNAIICNRANINEGEIKVPDEIITNDVTAYLVVGCVPTKVIRYRYTKEQIEELKKIAWWDWPDEKIRKCHDDFYLDIEKFIEKHKNRIRIIPNIMDCCDFCSSLFCDIMSIMESDFYLMR